MTYCFQQRRDGVTGNTPQGRCVPLLCVPHITWHCTAIFGVAEYSAAFSLLVQVAFALIYCTTSVDHLASMGLSVRMWRTLCTMTVLHGGSPLRPQVGKLDSPTKLLQRLYVLPSIATMQGHQQCWPFGRAGISPHRNTSQLKLWVLNIQFGRETSVVREMHVE